MRLVRAALAAKVRDVAVIGAVLGAKTLLRGPRLDQGAINGKMPLRHETLGLPVHFREELRWSRLFGQFSPIFGWKPVFRFRLL